ncbi:CBS domain-containing protein [sulfur-oxidizing endosymbiont of Gigantopelta aegis]|uniref:CBS domain-containing protein n=1 Tax=sulfur-oxidizing endosymbiont of Gigantopelta aegis TaxID=2794934 RepID=UPI0018DDA13D|nr:CBS domain-containing protein [sulfur-oxidizing endosymbiont of Gigantopelta aegis]
MITVGELLDSKGHSIWSAAPDDTVFEAIKLMDEKGVGALAVLNDGALVGMISERDYARRVILKGRSSKNTTVKDIMSTQVYYTFPSQTVDDCMVVMSERRIRHLPVLKGDELIGMVSVGDLIKDIIAEQKHMIEQLEHYIAGDET